MARRSFLLAACVSAAALLTACPDDPPADPCDTPPVGDPSVEILGAPDDSGLMVEPFVPGGDRALVRGPQAGFHVWVNLNVKGVCLHRLTIRRKMFATDTDEQLVEAAERITFQPVPGDPTTGRLEQAFTFFMCPDSLDRPIDGRPMRMEVEIVDQRGRHADTQAELVPRCLMSTQAGEYFDACRVECAGLPRDGGAGDASTVPPDGG